MSKIKAVTAKVLGTMVLAASIQLPASSQAAFEPNRDVQTSANSPTHATEQTVALSLLVREIDDPHSGARWLLLIDARHPGGPGRLVLADAARRESLPRKADIHIDQTLPQSVINTGEKLILEEHSPVVDARLDAIALNPAVVGGDVRVRLVIGGNVVRALAVGPGRVVLAQQKEGRP